MTVRMLVILATLSGCAKLDYIHQTPAGDRYEIRGYSFGSTSTVDSFSLHSGEDGKDVRIGGREWRVLVPLHRLNGDFGDWGGVAWTAEMTAQAFCELVRDSAKSPAPGLRGRTWSRSD
jgi:hypothetical protein